MMEKCFECYAENGLTGTGIKALADACGCTKANLYSYFKNLDELIIIVFLSEDKLIKNIRIHNLLTVISMLSVLSAIIIFVLFVSLLAAGILAGSVVCLIVCGLCITSSVMVFRYCKRETLSTQHPYEIILAREFDYSEIRHILLQKADSAECLDFENGSAFFCFLNKKLKNRILMVNTADFNKSAFDSTKKKINKAVNKKYNVKHWVSSDTARKMMRTNIIVTDKMNGSLYDLLSNNADILLRRVEGIINFAIVGNRLIVPPLYGENEVSEIWKYKNQ